MTPPTDEAVITKERAEALFASLHDALVDAEAKIIEIIQTEAWIPLGYASFADAWNDRMKGVRLGTRAMRAHVVYALLDTQTDEAIEAAVVGVSGVGVASLRRQKNVGVPADLAVVRTHLRHKPSKPATIHVTVSSEEHLAWSELASSWGKTLAEESELAIREHFTALRS